MVGGQDSKQHTVQPYVTGTSVIGLKCADGVVLGADTLVSYGSLAKNRKTSRLMTVSNHCSLGFSGEYSDFQEIQSTLEELMIAEYCMADKIPMQPRAIHQYLARVMYEKRNKQDPLYNQIVIGGVSPATGEGYLGLVDLLGTNYESEMIATGYGTYIALPLLRKAYRPDITVAEGRKVIEDCLRVLFYRDARSIDTVQIASVTKDGAETTEPFKLESTWEFKKFKAGSRLVDESTW
mmetsp:Transcript_27946/g.109661  ORF Transcript_27946/g.109661 Transcript_27946/m.109661 type:complete len:237 (-) Transcript_27946:1794-2504(-)|eukprot:CAMPEP_0113955366 /NCGR_PEP_ID=MMETSP0011_2-20120614/1281_1 /TAXON_ID=101924 /ORGANISM="Rhodosorus marinus" /LENGTH=236 /DNA_ID=CAMNT_0000965023 /DNA_START=44 /DNA_END=754 /DNA_ORIENTATION=+ /assembly_acc=CAM_ASM_000156